MTAIPPLDNVLLWEAGLKATGANIHRVNTAIAKYKNAHRIAKRRTGGPATGFMYGERPPQPANIGVKNDGSLGPDLRVSQHSRGRDVPHGSSRLPRGGDALGSTQMCLSRSIGIRANPKRSNGRGSGG